jgi:hypothetical protein
MVNFFTYISIRIVTTSWRPSICEELEIIVGRWRMAKQTIYLNHSLFAIYQECLDNVDSPSYVSPFLFFHGIRIWTQSFTLAKQALSHMSHTSNPFSYAYSRDGIMWTICAGWPWIMILSPSVSQVTRITGISHQCPISLYLIKYIQSNFYLNRFNYKC